VDPLASGARRGGYYWDFRKILQAFLASALQTSKERRGIRPCFAKLQIFKSNPA
jgi:hypothetical protein